MKNILIVENDLGFIFWLGGALMAADYRPWPAGGVSEANALTGKTAIAIDLLIVNPSLPGVSKLIAVLRRSQAKLKVIALGAEGEIDGARLHSTRIQRWPKGVDRICPRHQQAKHAAVVFTRPQYFDNRPQSRSHQGRHPVTVNRGPHSSRNADDRRGIGAPGCLGSVDLSDVSGGMDHKQPVPLSLGALPTSSPASAPPRIAASGLDFGNAPRVGLGCH